jgi:16S rRNA (cytosine1402-N4)-methyltransferase
MSIHRTVLLKETIDGLNLSPEAMVLDGTFGGGGHSAEILKRFPKAKIIALDQDQNALIGNDNRISFYHENFRNLDKVVAGKKVDAIIFDLGLSSDQLENSGRGFSFKQDEPLLMTLMENPGPEDTTAHDVVNHWDEKNLADIIYGYGEERYSRKIAGAIVEAREKMEIKTTFDLVKIIGEAVPAAYKRGRLHFATRIFQAIRIAVNDELGALQEGLEKGFDALKINGRMAVISFHSLEDRIVKNFYKEKTKEKKAILINKKPILANSEELKDNPRARSAKLRILEKNETSSPTT